MGRRPPIGAVLGALFFGGGVLLFLQRTNALEAAPGIVFAVVATMAGLGILFFEVLFRDLVDPASAKEYIAAGDIFFPNL